MPQMIIDMYIFFALVIITILSIIAAIMVYFTIKKNCPDAMVDWEASRKGFPVCIVHFRGRRARHYIAKIEESEKDLGTNYWTVPAIGIKFKPEPNDVEFIENGLAAVNYFEQIPEAINTNVVVAFSQLKDYFKKIGMPIEGIESIATYVASENEAKSDKTAALRNARIESEETKKYLQNYLNAINTHRNELMKIKLESGVFTYQTAMMALDNVIAHTSSHVSHMKATLWASFQRKMDLQNRNMIIYIVLMVAIGLVAAMVIAVAHR